MSIPCKNVCTPWYEGELDCSGAGVIDVEIANEALGVASDLLFELSGRQFPGSCQDVIRPCADISWCGCASRSFCHCTRPREIKLGRDPISAVPEVKVDGVILVAGTDYRVDNHSTLVRLPDADGRNEGWPCCQRADLQPGEEGTFDVTVNYGEPPPRAGVLAAKVLACELAKSALGEDCDLPQRVQSVTRQGVSMVLLDPFSMLDDGKTGLFEVDLFLRTYNRGGLQRRARVWSPDTHHPVRKVGTDA